jgi:hypothetical protein
MPAVLAFGRSDARAAIEQNRKSTNEMPSLELVGGKHAVDGACRIVRHDFISYKKAGRYSERQACQLISWIWAVTVLPPLQPTFSSTRRRFCLPFLRVVAKFSGK